MNRPQPPTKSRYCQGCKDSRPLEEFSRRGKGSLHDLCRECLSKADKAAKKALAKAEAPPTPLRQLLEAVQKATVTKMSAINATSKKDKNRYWALYYHYNAKALQLEEQLSSILQSS